jgi:hypothetical protein
MFGVLPYFVLIYQQDIVSSDKLFVAQLADTCNTTPHPVRPSVCSVPSSSPAPNTL